MTEVSELEAVTQSGVSRALARLEAEIGTPLLQRSGRILRMTHAGAVFKRHVDAVLHHLDDGIAAVSQLIDPDTGLVALAFQHSLGTWLVPDLVRSFRAAHPDVRFQLTQVRDELHSPPLAGGQADLEIGTRRPHDPATRVRRLALEPLRLALRLAAEPQTGLAGGFEPWRRCAADAASAVLPHRVAAAGCGPGRARPARIGHRRRDHAAEARCWPQHRRRVSLPVRGGAGPTCTSGEAAGRRFGRCIRFLVNIGPVHVHWSLHLHAQGSMMMHASSVSSETGTWPAGAPRGVFRQEGRCARVPRGRPIVPSHQLAVHRTIVVVDAEGFSDPSRTNTDQLAVREGLYKALDVVLYQGGYRLGVACDHEDCGDGALILVPPHVPKILLVTKWPARLATALNRHNAACGTGARVRLRIAVHAGEVVYDRHGVTGCAINRTFRLVQAPALKEALACSPGTYALIASEWIYNEVVRHAPEGRPADYRQIHVAVKETRAAAWLRAGDGGIPRARAGRRTPAKRRGRRRDVLAVQPRRTGQAWLAGVLQPGGDTVHGEQEEALQPLPFGGVVRDRAAQRRQGPQLQVRQRVHVRIP